MVSSKGQMLVTWPIPPASLSFSSHQLEFEDYYRRYDQVKKCESMPRTARKWNHCNQQDRHCSRVIWFVFHLLSSRMKDTEMKSSTNVFLFRFHFETTDTASPLHFFRSEEEEEETAQDVRSFHSEIELSLNRLWTLTTNERMGHSSVRLIVRISFPLPTNVT